MTDLENQLKAELRKAKEANDKLAERLDAYEKDSTKRAFYSLNRLLNLQADELNSFDLKSEVKVTVKDDKRYDRMNKMWEKMPDLIESVHKLKGLLSLTGNLEIDNPEGKSLSMFSPETIASATSNT